MLLQATYFNRMNLRAKPLGQQTIGVRPLVHGLGTQSPVRGHEPLVLSTPSRIRPQVEAPILLVFTKHQFGTLIFRQLAHAQDGACKGSFTPALFLIYPACIHIAVVSLMHAAANGIPGVAIKQHIALIGGVGTHGQVGHVFPVNASQFNGQRTQCGRHRGVQVDAEVE